jgi:hypothetical protein
MRSAKKLSLGLYLVSTGLSAALLGLAFVVALALMLQDGEVSVGIAFTWLFSLPLVGLLSLATMATYSRYRRLKMWKQTVPFFVGQTLIVAVLAWTLAYTLDNLGLLISLYEAMG